MKVRVDNSYAVKLYVLQTSYERVFVSYDLERICEVVDFAWVKMKLLVSVLTYP